MIDFQILFSFILSTIVIAILPGPDLIFVLLQSITYGRKHGLVTTLGLMIGCLIHTTLVAFGISLIIKQYSIAFLTIKILGAMYLMYLAFRVLINPLTIAVNLKSCDEKTPLELLRVGFLMNLLNPKVTLFFLALFPGFLFSERLSLVLQFYVLGGLFIVISLVIFSLVAFLGGIISDLIQQYKQLGLWLKWIQAVTYLLISAFILM